MNKPPLKVTLKSAVLSPLETLAQSIALLGPTITPAMIVPLVFGSSGYGTCMVFACATLGVCLTAITLNFYGTRRASAGSIYSYVELAFGKKVALVAGWALFFAYITGGAAALVGFANYLIPAMLALTGMKLPSLAVITIAMLICWLISFKDIRLSTNVMLGLECISVALIAVVLTAVLIQHKELDLGQLTLKGVTAESFRLGLVMAIFSFVGFESASTLGDEADKPLSAIPTAMILSVLLPGMLFVVASYAEIVGFSGAAQSLAKSNAPLNELSVRSGLQILSTPIDLCASVSFFTCCLAAINAGARVLLCMGREGAVHSSVTAIHEKNQTPYFAAAITTILMLTGPAVLLSMGYGSLDVYGWIGTISTFGFITAYLMACAGVPLFLTKENVQSKVSIAGAIAFFSASFLFIALAGNVWPVPPAPYCFLPYVFLAYLATSTTSSIIHQRLSSKKLTATPE